MSSHRSTSVDTRRSDNECFAVFDADERQIPSNLEIGYIPHFEGGMFPGLYLFTVDGRLIREVRQIVSGM